LITIPKGRFPVTIAGATKLHEEFENLETKRSEVAANIRTAKGFGDLSENFEYHEAKREGGMVAGRIQQLKIIIPDLLIVKPEDVLLDQVGFGAIVSVREDTGEELEYFLVGPLEADPLEDRISYESPLGSALMGKRIGEIAEVAAPAGRIQVEITGIRAYEV